MRIQLNSLVELNEQVNQKQSVMISCTIVTRFKKTKCKGLKFAKILLYAYMHPTLCIHAYTELLLAYMYCTLNEFLHMDK